MALTVMDNAFARVRLVLVYPDVEKAFGELVS